MKAKTTMVSGIIDDIRRMYQVLTEQSRKVEYETSLTGPQLWAVKVLNASAPLKVSELAKRMYLHPATMVGILDRLVSKGLVERNRSETDRRVVYVNLTNQGRELVANSPEVVQDLLIKGLEPLDLTSLSNISEGIGKVVSILGAKSIPPKLIMSSEINFPKRTKKNKAISDSY